MESLLSEIMKQASNEGVDLWVEEGALHFRTTQGPLSDSLRSSLKAHRQQIIDTLKSKEGDSLIEPSPEEAHMPFPLTDVQSAYLLGRRESVQGGGVSCHAYFEVEMPGITLESLQRAFEAIIRRYDSLRTMYDESGFQQVLPFDEIDVPKIANLSSDDESSCVELRGTMSHAIHEIHKPPLMGVGLSHAKGVDTVHVSIDFLVADWTSMMVILDTFFEAAKGKALPENDARITFRDYVIAAQKINSDKDRKYWEDRYQDIAIGVDVPMLGSAWKNQFKRLDVKLSKELKDGFLNFAKRVGVSPSALLLALYGASIANWSAQKRNAIVVTLFDRKPLHPDVKKLTGDFTSTGYAVLEQRGQSLGDLAKESFMELMGIVEHNSYSGVAIMRDITLKNGGNKGASYPFVFTSALSSDRKEEFSHNWSISYAITQTPQVGVDFQAAIIGTDLCINWDVRQGVFPDGMIETMFESFCSTLTRVSLGKIRPEDPIIFEVPKDQALTRSHVQQDLDQQAAGRSYAEEMLFDGLLRQAKEHPDRIAVVDSHNCLTFLQLRKRADAIAFQLSEAGIGPKDHVGICMTKGAEQIACVYGTLLAGCTYVPINPSHPDARKEAVAARAGLKALLSNSDALWFRGAVLSPETSLCQTSRFDLPSPPNNPSNNAYAIFTSGSTGEPKGVLVSHKAALNTIQDICARFDVGSDTVALGVSNLDFDLSVFDIFGVIGSGGTLVLVEQGAFANPTLWAQAACSNKITFWNSAPAQMSMMLDATSGERTLPDSLHTVLLSGDWVPTDIAERIHQECPCTTVAALGGATEASIWSNIHIMDEDDRKRQSVPYGASLTNQRMDVLDENLMPRPNGVLGEICISGLGLAKEYLDDESLTRKKFVYDSEGIRWYKTGDIGRWLPHGEIELLGRKDTQVKIQGNRIELSEVEAAANRCTEVKNSCALVLSENEGKRLALCVSPESSELAQRSNAKTNIRNLLSEVDSLAKRQMRRLRSRDTAEEACEVGVETTLVGLIYRFAIGRTIGNKHGFLRIVNCTTVPDSFIERVLSSLEGFEYVFIIQARNEKEADFLKDRWSSQPHVQVQLPSIETKKRPDFQISDAYCDIALLPDGLEELWQASCEMALSPQALLINVKPTLSWPFSQGTLASTVFSNPEKDADEDTYTATSRMLFIKDAMTLEIHISLRAYPQFRIDIDELQAQMSGVLPSVAVPKTIYVVNHFPLTENGKIDRKALSNAVTQKIESFKTQGDEGEDKYGILDLTRKQLGKLNLSLDDNLISFGADSLIMAKIIARIRTEVPEAENVSYDAFLRAILDKPSARSLVEAIDEKLDAKIDSPESTFEEGLVTICSDEDAFSYPDTARIIMHGATGRLDGLNELIATLKEGRTCPLFVITLADEDRYLKTDPQNLADEFSELYAKRISELGYQKVQLIGHSIGGVFAASTAAYLQAIGIDASAIVIDSLSMPFSTEDDLFSELIFCMTMGCPPHAVGFSEKDLSALPEAFQQLLNENEGSIPCGGFAEVKGTPEFDALAQKALAFYQAGEENRAARYAQILLEIQGSRHDPDWVFSKIRC